MKKFIVLLVLVMVSSSVFSQEMTELQNRHISAMKYYGHMHLVKNDISKIELSLTQIDRIEASVFFSDTLASAYAEKDGLKVYWYVEKSKDGVHFVVKSNDNGVISSGYFELTINEEEIRLKSKIDAEFQKSGDRFKIDWDCLKSKLPGCIACGFGWQCWLLCGGSSVWQCTKLFREEEQKRSFSCPRCGHGFYAFARFCNNCKHCSFPGTQCNQCWSNNTGNGKKCSRCGNCYR